MKIASKQLLFVVLLSAIMPAALASSTVSVQTNMWGHIDLPEGTQYTSISSFYPIKCRTSAAINEIKRKQFMPTYWHDFLTKRCAYKGCSSFWCIGDQGMNALFQFFRSNILRTVITQKNMNGVMTWGMSLRGPNNKVINAAKHIDPNLFNQYCAGIVVENETVTNDKNLKNNTTSKAKKARAKLRKRIYTEINPNPSLQPNSTTKSELAKKVCFTQCVSKTVSLRSFQQGHCWNYSGNTVGSTLHCKKPAEKVCKSECDGGSYL